MLVIFLMNSWWNIFYVTIHILYQGWPTQLYHWANISAPIVKRAAKLLLMTNSHYFTSFSSNFLMTFFWEPHISPLYFQKPIPPKFFWHLNKTDLPRKIFPPLKKGVQLDNSKKGRTSLPRGPRVGHPCIISSLYSIHYTLYTIDTLYNRYRNCPMYKLAVSICARTITILLLIIINVVYAFRGMICKVKSLKQWHKPKRPFL